MILAIFYKLNKNIIGVTTFYLNFPLILFLVLYQQLKKNLSTAALKGFRCPESSTPIKTRSRSIENQVPPGSPIQVSAQAPNLTNITGISVDILKKFASLSGIE